VNNQFLCLKKIWISIQVYNRKVSLHFENQTNHHK
jgi:hypothetical protein